MHAPRDAHWAAVKRILRYVCGTMGYGLSLHASPSTLTDLVAYSDADWAGCPDTRRSTGGYCVYLGSSLVSWSSKRQPTVSRSSAEAEYRTVANVVAECTWLRQLLSELSCPVDKATVVFCDNVSAVYLFANPVHHRRTKHIELDIHFIHMASPINFNQFLEKEKLKSNGSNFTDWFRHVRIFLNGGNLQYVLDAPLGDPPAETETDEVKNVYATRKTRYSQVQCAILCSLESDLQKRFEHHDPHELMKELKTIFETHAAVECYEASKHFFSCMMEEGSSISEHMLAMTGHAKKLSDLGIVIPNRLGINRVLQSLPPSYKNFVMNYNMQNMNKEFPELFGMLKAAEIEIKKEHQVLMVNKTTSFKKQGKSKGKFKKGGKKAATPPET
ncbi:hypothetical protein QYE76_022788 [Lolium multiflorum]|uniref:Uncharacterized protein n=1 Tax=Lolium multiflorum TaxID=4521 RepID=A0AAD8VTJ5_LOLMU|nr:hypothetical protein QYE76_022788 [Lolium multiflorum]